MTDATRTNEPNETRPRGIFIVALLMILFGLAEVVTGFTHRFFGISTTEGTASTYAGAAIGTLYLLAGALILPMTKRAAGLALLFLAVDVIGRVSMVLIGFYPTNSFKQTAAIALGTALVVIFAVYIGSKWRFFR
jgi:hypothetical protein